MCRGFVLASGGRWGMRIKSLAVIQPQCIVYRIAPKGVVP